MLVGNVISVSGLSARFTTGSTGVNGKLFASGLKGIKTFLGPSGEVDVDGGSHASSKIGWATNGFWRNGEFQTGNDE